MSPPIGQVSQKIEAVVPSGENESGSGELITGTKSIMSPTMVAQS